VQAGTGRTERKRPQQVEIIKVNRSKEGHKPGREIFFPSAFSFTGFSSFFSSVFSSFLLF